MIILDTNVVSELMRPSPAESIVEWVSGQDISNLYLSTITEAELRYGVEIVPTGRRRGGAADPQAYAGSVEHGGGEEVEYPYS